MTLVDKNATRNYIFWNTKQLEYSLHRQMILVPVKNGTSKSRFLGVLKNLFDQVDGIFFENGRWSKYTKYVVFGVISIFLKISKNFQNLTFLGFGQIFE